MIVRKNRITARDAALQLAEERTSTFDAATLARIAGCSSVTAQVTLSTLTAEGLLDRVARGTYARPGLFPKYAKPIPGPTTMARGVQEAARRELEAADEWLRDCPPLPRNRPPVFDAPRARRSV